MFNRILALFIINVLLTGSIMAQKPLEKTPARQRLQWYKDYLLLKRESVFKYPGNLLGLPT